MTLLERLAMAVLRGDGASALALADEVKDVYGHPTALPTVEERGSGYPDSHAVYRWPEFRAFADRLGFAWPLNTLEFSIFFPQEGPVEIVQSYRPIPHRTTGRSAPVDVLTVEDERPS